MRRKRLAVVLFNLGGPDRPQAVWPFLVNLFSDRAIIRAPLPIRFFLARFIASRRLKPAQENYALLGGRSPLLDLTTQQAEALQTALHASDTDTRCFVAMRYWHPFAGAVARAVRGFAPDEIVLVPLYPQFSTTTSGSSIADWQSAAAQAGLVADVTTLCCWHSDPGVTAAIADLLRTAYHNARAALPDGTRLRVLFSAHGLPESIVKAGDPYQFQVERSVAATVQALALPDLDHRICYQSRATPQKWIDPSTDHEVEQAARDGVALLVVPIAFVSDHSETLVELDVEYRDLALKLGVPGYFRAPVPNTDPAFIAALAALVRRSRTQGPGLCSFRGQRTCPKQHAGCPHGSAATRALASAPEE